MYNFIIILWSLWPFPAANTKITYQINFKNRQTTFDMRRNAFNYLAINKCVMNIDIYANTFGHTWFSWSYIWLYAQCLCHETHKCIYESRAPLIEVDGRYWFAGRALLFAGCRCAIEKQRSRVIAIITYTELALLAVHQLHGECILHKVWWDSAIRWINGVKIAHIAVGRVRCAFININVWLGPHLQNALLHHQHNQHIQPSSLVWPLVFINIRANELCIWILLFEPIFYYVDNKY